MIVFKCIACSSRLRVSEDKAGKRGKCPSCSMMVRVPRSQVEADTADAHRAVVQARKLSEQQHRRDADDDIFGQVVGEVLSGRPVRKSPVRHDPKRDALGVDAVGPRSAPAESPPPDAPEPPGEAPAADEADHEAFPLPSPGAPAEASDPVTPDEPAEASDPDALRRSAEAPSAPPMSWPAEPADPADASEPPSDLDALARAVRTPRPRRAPASAGEDSTASLSDYGQTVADRAETGEDMPETPARQADPSARDAREVGVTVKGNSGLLSLLVLLVVVAGVLGLVGWRIREHVWRFRQPITRCLPSVAFLADAEGQRATPGCLAGGILLCDEFGAPCPLTISLDPLLVARAPGQVGTVVFIRRKDDAPRARAFRVMGSLPARPPVCYELCAVDAASGRRVCVDAVVAADEDQALQDLRRLIERSARW